MINSERPPTCAEVKAWDMVNYLSGLGHNPEKIKGDNYWYLSPLRIERTASFKINRRLNCWYDHGTGKGGNLIDFAILYHGCTVKKLLADIKIYPPSFRRPFYPALPTVSGENKIKVLNEFPIGSAALVNYLSSRRIPLEIAGKYCTEIHYRLQEKTYYALGFKNDAGGYELRNPYFKNSSTPKSITTIKNGSAQMAIFEGFFDFLSFVVLQQHEASFQWDFCILNSLSFFEKTRPFLKLYNSIHLYLDNDTAGQNCSLAAVKRDSKYVNESKLFTGYKDINEWLVGNSITERIAMRKGMTGGMAC